MDTIEKLRNTSPLIDLTNYEVPAIEREELEDLPPQLIDKLFFQGGKLLVTGASKSGKSFLLIELACALATGTDWLGFWCKESRVLYVNLELDSRMFRKRVFDVSMARRDFMDKIQNNLGLLTLRGRVNSITTLVDSIGMSFERGMWDVIIIDPAYKLQPGNENDAEAINSFTCELDRLIEEQGCSVVFTHHHPKMTGKQARERSVSDRGAGSGVFGRDADTLIDLSELEEDETVKAVRAMNLHPEDARVFKLEFLVRYLQAIKPKFTWFDYPLHELDRSGMFEEEFEDQGAVELRRFETELDKFMGREKTVPRRSFESACGLSTKKIDRLVTRSEMFRSSKLGNLVMIERV